MTEDPESESAPETPGSVASAFSADLAVALDQIESYEAVLAEAQRDFVEGRSSVQRLARVATQSPFWTLLAVLGRRDLDLDEEVRVTLGEQREQQLHVLHRRYHPVLEAAGSAALENLVYGIENSWTDVRADPSYFAAESILMLRFQLLAGVDVLYRSVDRLEDFLRLARTLMFVSSRALTYAVERKLPIQAAQATLLRALASELGEKLTELNDQIGLLPDVSPPAGGKDSGA